MNVANVSPAQLEALQREGETVELIDVRTPLEYRQVHARPARNVPLDGLDPHAVVAARGDAEGRPLYLICKSGSRGARACQRFIDAGFANVVNVAGGTDAWEAAGLPVERGKEAVSLERQVRIAAGSIVLISGVLALLWDVRFVALAIFVGAGLVFAGATDSCAMASVLAKMPWNRVSDDGPSCPIG